MLISLVLNNFHKTCICWAQSNRAMNVSIEVGVKAPARWQKMINGVKLLFFFENQGCLEAKNSVVIKI